MKKTTLDMTKAHLPRFKISQYSILKIAKKHQFPTIIRHLATRQTAKF